MTRSAFVVLAVLASSSAFAAKKKEEAPAPVASPAATASSSYGTSAETNLTASLGAIDGNLALGVGLQFEWPVVIEGNNFGVGFQTGLYYSGYTETNTLKGTETKIKAWGVPVLVTGKYLFQNTIDFIKPYLALGMGVGIDRAVSKETTSGFLTSDKNSNDVHFALLIRPGMTIGSTQTWFVEAPVGVMFTSFAILPTVGVHF